MASFLVIGGDGGVGSEVVAKLVARGEAVTATVRSARGIEKLHQQFADRMRVRQLDLSDADAALARLREIVDEMPTLEAVLVCAALAPNGPVELTALSEFRTVFEVNCLANVAVYQAAMPKLRQSRGRIVFMSSASGKIGTPFMGAYTASKFALEGVADIMRREAARQGVKIVLVEPGGIRTEMLMTHPTPEQRLPLLSEEARTLYSGLYHRYHDLVQDIIANSAAEPGDIADIVVRACDAPSPAPRYPAGADATQMIAMTAAMTDAELDQMFDAMFFGEASQISFPVERGAAGTSS